VHMEKEMTKARGKKEGTIHKVGRRRERKR
jgi:hypothetical protein